MGTGRSRFGRRIGLIVTGSATACALAACPAATPTATSGQAAPSAMPSSPGPGAAAPASPLAPAPAGATAAPTAIPSTPDTSSRATIQGIVFDSAGQRVDGAVVTGKVLGAGTFANGSDTLSVTTQQGSYALNGAPTGQTVLVTITKDGFIPRQQTVVPLANLQGDPNQNRLDFGSEAGSAGNATYALGSGVEVISATPVASESGVDPATDFTLTFSGPVRRDQVEAAFALYVAGRLATPGEYAGPTDHYTLSAVDGAGTPMILHFGYDLALDDGSAQHTPQQVMPGLGTHRLYDASAFTTTWQNDQTVTFHFKPGYRLPTDKDPAKRPTIVMTLEGKPVGAPGSSVVGDPVRFHLSVNQPGTYGVAFKPLPDTVAPRIVGVVGVNRSDAGGGAPQDRLRITFSEPMHLFPVDLGGAAIPALGSPTSATRPGHYAYAVQTSPPTGAEDSALQVLATNAASGLEATDPSHQTIYVAPDSDDPAAAEGRGFTSGSVVWVRAGSGMTDPAGNALDVSAGNDLRSGRAI
jgi:hypothetical protein